MKAARIFYRLVVSGAEIVTEGEKLHIRQAVPMTDEQRQALRDHKVQLIDLADWYADDVEIIRNLTEDQFTVLVRGYTTRHGHYWNAIQ